MSDAANSIVVDTTPWDEPVDGAKVLDEAVKVLRRHIDGPPFIFSAMALWDAVAHFADVVDVLPNMVLSGPTNQCGKSLSLELNGCLVPRPLPAGNITSASIYRVIPHKPTLLL